MNQEEKNKIKEAIDLLLNDSIIDENLIGVLRENIENFTEEELTALLDSLQKEQVELKKAIDHVSEAGKEGDEAWKNLEKEQALAADEIMDEMVDELIKSGLKKNDGGGEAEGWEKKLAMAATLGEILGALDGVEVLKGAEGAYRAEDQKKYIRHLFSGKDKNYLNFLAPSLKKKVEEIFDAENKNA